MGGTLLVDMLEIDQFPSLLPCTGRYSGSKGIVQDSLVTRPLFLVCAGSVCIQFH